MDERLPGLEEDTKELTPLNAIRTETALSRFPVHRIAKKGHVRIELKHHASAVLWRVSYNSDYGHPGPLAYKLDTLIVNRRIEEAGRPIPKLIRLGSLRDIAEEIGTGEKNTNSVKQALLQNAFAGITAKIIYRAQDKTERSLEAGFTRYSVVFTGESLPDGTTADVVYLVLNDIYMEVLNVAVTRPLDYDYMKALPPAAQRFYEIASYQIYAALLHQNERARLRYSEYCLLSTATRYLDFDHVKKQMYKIHKPHLESGYLAKVAYEHTTDADGLPDWFMYYVPGPNASREYREFTGNIRKAGRGEHWKTREPQESGDLFLLVPENGAEQAASGTPRSPEAPPPPQATPAAANPDPETQTLVAMLTAADLNRGDAERLAREKPEECRRQLAFLPFVTEFKTSRGAYLRRAIEQGFAPPTGYVRQQREEEAWRKKQEQAVAKSADIAAQEARRRAEAAQLDEILARLETDAPARFTAFLAYVESERGKIEAKYTRMSPSIRARMSEHFDTPDKWRELFQMWQALPEAEQMLFSPVGPHDTSATQPVTDDPAAVRAAVAAVFEEKPV